MEKIVLYLFFISLNSFLIPFFFGKKLGYKGTFLFIIISSIINVLLSIFLFIQILSLNDLIHIELYYWISIELINIVWGFLLDPISASMLIIITYISFCAHLYSFEYLKGDPHLNRFCSYLSLFTFFMILLVLSENLIQLFIGWEGVGICSYLLINFWSGRIQANKSSILAVLANKVGDLTLLIAALLLQYIYKNVSFLYIKGFNFFYENVFELQNSKTRFVQINTDHFNWNDFYISRIIDRLIHKIISYKPLHEIRYDSTKTMYYQSLVIDANDVYNNYWFLDSMSTFQWISLFNSENFEFIALLLILSSIGKSAQFGFHFWLPEAMEGPTPVSSLIHAATMVTAGIFLILRFSDFFVIISNSISIIVLIGSITLFFASSVGLTQTDIKKIIAYSTCSQLGYMFLSCGFHNYANGMYHLFIHAFFKALLFLTAGYLIHLLSNEQDIRKMGGLLKLLPFSYSMMIIGSYSLAGLPYLSGFYSKDPLIENIIMTYYNSFFFSKNSLIYIALILALLTVLITAIYSIKSIVDIYYNSFKGYSFYIKQIHYSSYFIQLPLILLCIATIYSGYIFQEAFIGINNDFIAKSVFVSKSNIHYIFDSIHCNYHSIDHNQSFISEFYPYYRFYLIHLLLYTLSSYIILKMWIIDFFYFVVVSTIWNFYSSILKKYIYLNRLVIITTANDILYFSKELFLSLIDKGILEISGPYGIYSQLQTMFKIMKLQSGYLYHYIGYIYMSLIISFFFIIVLY